MEKLTISVRRRDIRPEDLVLAQNYDVLIIELEPEFATPSQKFKIARKDRNDLNMVEVIKMIRHITKCDLETARDWAYRVVDGVGG